MKTTIISFYSDIGDDKYYTENYKRLAHECFSYGIPHDFRNLESHNDYRLNCLRKPQFILDVLREKKEPIVWLDIDSTIHSSLDIFDDAKDHCDLAFAFPSFNNEGIPNSAPKASPIFVNYNEKVIAFLQFWVDACQESITLGEKFFDHEILLLKVLPKNNHLRILTLPHEYCVWPGRCPEGVTPIITMGIADGASKEKNLRELAPLLGMSESNIQFNLNKV